MNIIINLTFEQQQQKSYQILYAMRTFTKSEMILFLPIFRWSSNNHGFDRQIVSQFFLPPIVRKKNAFFNEKLFYVYIVLDFRPYQF